MKTLLSKAEAFLYDGNLLVAVQYKPSPTPLTEKLSTLQSFKEHSRETGYLLLKTKTPTRQAGEPLRRGRVDKVTNHAYRGKGKPILNNM